MSTSEYPAPRLDPPRLTRLRGLAARVTTPVSADVWAVAGLIALAAAIRILTINNQSFWTDEALTAYEVRLPFGAMMSTVTHVETTPPLYFVLVWGWAKLFGTSEIALRSISTLAGIALVPIAYASAKELASRWAGVIAAALVTVNPFLIWYSQEARCYMLLATLTAAGFLWFVRAREDPSGRNLAWWAACSALALTTHFFAGFAVAPEGLWLLWIARSRATWAAVAVVAAVQVAMLPFAVADTTHGTGWIAAVPRVKRVGGAALEWGVSLLRRNGTATEGFLAAGILIVIVTLLVLLAGDERTRRTARTGAVVGGFVIIAPLVPAVFGQDYWLSRYVIPAFVPLVVVIAAACAAPRARVLGGALAVALLAIFAYAAIDVQTSRGLQRSEWRNLARALGAAPVPRAVLAANGDFADPLKIYMPHVNWVTPRAKRVLISEIDVVGARGQIPLTAALPREAVSREEALTDVAPQGSTGRVKGQPVPSFVAPPGTRLVARFRVVHWVVARFALKHPERLDVRALLRLAPRYFRHTPRSLLVFFQKPGR
jgi:4-amino-4-deoxy-L-arabinose transferase-like glycosyltransferase